MDLLRRAVPRLAIGAGLAALVGTANASDGIVEINHACAIAGCFSGDTPGFPVTIDGTAGRSYRLTSDLIVPNANTSGIVMSVNDVSVDLARFAIMRSGCESATTNCTPAAGNGNGVGQSTAGLRGFSVSNKSVIGMGQYGVILGADSIVQNVRTRWNRSSGIFVAGRSLVRDRVSNENGSGIAAGNESTIINNTTINNTGAGIGADESTIIGNTASLNGARGISAFTRSTVIDNVVRDNDLNGILGGEGALVRGNVVSQNTGSGILAGPGALVQSNVVSDNTGHGLDLGTGTGYRENVICGNTLGSVRGSGANLGSNLCDGGTCP